MQATAQSGGVAYKWIVALVVIFGAFMRILDQTIVNIAIPRLQSAFGADLNGVQWVLTAYILTQGVVTPTTAFFTNRVGIKRFYVLSLSLFTLGSALCGLAWSLPILITFRIIQGIGGAFLFPVAITLLYQEFPPNQRGLASGIFGIAALLAPAVGPTLGGYIVTYADWPLIFFINVPYLTSNIANVLITFAFFGGLFIFPVYLQNLRGLSAFQAGLLLLPQAFASIISALIGGRIVDRVGVRVVVIPGLVVLAFTLWQFTFLTLDTPYIWLQGMFVLRGIALGLIIQPLNVSALSDINPRRFAQASSLYTVMRFVSTSLGIAVLATLVQTQAKIHYSHLAELVTSASPPGQLVTRLQQYFFTQGIPLQNTRAAAIQEVIRLVQRQGYMLALQDAFWLTLIVILVAVVAAFFIRSRRQPAVAPSDGSSRPIDEEDREALLPAITMD